MLKKDTKFFCGQVIYFFFYSVLGWLYEVCLEVFIYRWGYSDRGVLVGPYCVIYGFGALLLIFSLKKLQQKQIKLWKINLTPLIVFFAIILIATTVELIGSYLMEAFTGKWMWNYTSYAWNFEGRIALNPSFRFGLGGMLFLYVLQPLFEKLVDWLPKRVVVLTGAGITLLFLIEFANLFLKLI